MISGEISLTADCTVPFHGKKLKYWFTSRYFKAVCRIPGTRELAGNFLENDVQESFIE
jgi:hypothetical protein